MRASAFARLIATLSIIVRNSGHSSYARRTSSSSPTASRAEPSPNQPARLMRAWLHANTHGIARRSSSDSTERPRRAGREPSASRPISSIGVTCANQGAKPGAFTSEKKRSRDAASITAAASAYRSAASWLRRSFEGAEASSTAAATWSMWRIAMAGSP